MQPYARKPTYIFHYTYLVLNRFTVKVSIVLEQMTDNEWIEHESAVSDGWKYFLRSKIKVSGNANRFRAKCKRCDAVMIGKSQRMMKHLIRVCKKKFI